MTKVCQMTQKLITIKPFHHDPTSLSIFVEFLSEQILSDHRMLIHRKLSVVEENFFENFKHHHHPSICSVPTREVLKSCLEEA